MMYEELCDDLRRRREQAQTAGGKLDDATEAAIAGELDIYWRKMGEEDRRRIEIRLERHHDPFALS
jgi:hypothetical protein